MSNQLVLVQNAIIKTLSSEMNTTGTNPLGRLKTIKSIGKSWLDKIGIYPYVGVLAVHEDRTWEASRRRKFEIIWQIIIATKSLVSLEEAYAQLFVASDDSIGNGVLVVLDDLANYSLGNLVAQSTVKKQDFYDDLIKGSQSGMDAFTAFDIVQYHTVSYEMKEGAVG